MQIDKMDLLRVTIKSEEILQSLNSSLIELGIDNRFSVMFYTYEDNGNILAIHVKLEKEVKYNCDSENRIKDALAKALKTEDYFTLVLDEVNIFIDVFFNYILKDAILKVLSYDFDSYVLEETQEEATKYGFKEITICGIAERKQ